MQRKRRLTNRENSSSFSKELSEAIFVHDFEGKIRKVNSKACERMEYTKKELESMNIANLVSAEFGDRPFDMISEVQKNKSTVFQSVHLTKSGKKIPVEVHANVAVFDDQAVIVGIAHDITVRENYELKLLEAKHLTEKNEAELRNIFNKVPSTIFILDEHKRVQRLNASGIKKFNIADDEIVNKFVGDLMICKNFGTYGCSYPEHCKNCDLIEIIDKAIKYGEELNKKEIALDLAENGIFKERFFLVSISAFTKNENTFYVLTLDDISERKRMEQELVVAKEKAEVSEKLKTAFLNTVSHEIRTPLNGILGFLDFFEDEKNSFEPKEKEKMFELVRISSRRLMNTVSDIVEASKITSGIIDTVVENVLLEPVVNSLVNDLKQKYTGKKIRVTVKIEQILVNRQMETDKMILTRILHNLLDNAFKFTREGDVVLDIKEQTNGIMFSVADTGIGIEQKDLEIIFEPFRQVDNTLTRAFDGSGLGLTIASKLAACLGGKYYG